MADRHKARDYKVQFCTVPSETKCTDCTEPKNYRKICEPSWGGFTFERLISGDVAPGKQYEAHHIVCVSPAQDELLGNSNIKVRGPVEATKWCINNGTNMMAMPVWGHYVKFYCSFAPVLGKVVGAMTGTSKEPDFKNIPAHDIDHNIAGGYTHEVRECLKDMAAEVSAQGHQVQASGLVAALNDLAEISRGALGDRGMRKGGTHEGWKLGADYGDPNWLHPFSMAVSPRVSTMGFPARNFSEKLDKWVKKIADAIAAGV
jgi:hypothetical protein